MVERLLLIDQRGGARMKRIRIEEKGFTLVELMRTVTVLAIIMSVGTHHMLGRIPKYQLKSAAHQIYSNIQFAKMRAVATNRTSWFLINNGQNYFSAFVDNIPNGTPDSLAEYEYMKADFSDVVSGVPCFILPGNVSFGWPSTYSGTGPDGVNPGGDTDGFFVAGDPSDNEIGFLPSGIPIVNPGAIAPPSKTVVIYLKNTLDDLYAVSVSLTGYVHVWQWDGSAWN